MIESRGKIRNLSLVIYILVTLIHYHCMIISKKQAAEIFTERSGFELQNALILEERTKKKCNFDCSVFMAAMYYSDII